MPIRYPISYIGFLYEACGPVVMNSLLSMYGFGIIMFAFLYDHNAIAVTFVIETLTMLFFFGVGYLNYREYKQAYDAMEVLRAKPVQRYPTLAEMKQSGEDLLKLYPHVGVVVKRRDIGIKGEQTP